jgi:hypothetical protein
MSATMLAATLTAQPTPTLLPPTDTPFPTATNTLPPPTETPAPTPTLTPTPALSATEGITATAPPFIGCFTPSGTNNLSAPFKLENFTKVTVTVSINGTTKEGDHTINCSYTVAKGASTIFTLWFGNYTYWVQVPGKKMYQGSFWINDSDKATMQITDKGVRIGPFP